MKVLKQLFFNRKHFATLTTYTRQLQQQKWKTLPNEAPVGTEFSYNIHDNYLELKENSWNGALKFHLAWLRDSCQCAVCRESTSGLKVASLPNFIKDGDGIKSVALHEDEITITWSDDHRTECSLSWLWKNELTGHSARTTSCVLPEKKIWNGAYAETINNLQVNYDDLIENDDVVRQFLKSVLLYGFAVVDKVPTNKESTRSVMERFGPIWPTFWGEIYHVIADLTVHSHPSYTAGDLDLHNDTNYYFEGAGLQAFQVLEHTGTGGRNKLVDGFYVAQKIKSDYPDVYEYLSTKTFSFKYIADGKLHLVNEDNILKHHPVTGELVQIRFTPYDLDTFRTVAQENVPEHYEALDVLRNELDNPDNGHWLQLSTGKLLVTDNWRVLHGRSSFSGRRVLCGMYVSRSDFLSRARKLGLL